MVLQGTCSFCGHSVDDGARLIAGPGDVAICVKCVAVCNEVIEDDVEPTQ
ncbi:MAG: ClpX C4-type zinc finger protein [Ferrimicrobium sp.]